MAITGVTGFIGSHLAEGFLAAGWDVSGIVRRGNRKAIPTGTVAIEAPLDADALIPALDGAALVVHAAGVAHARNQAAFDAVNVKGTEAVVGGANRVGARVLYVSSQAAAGVGTASKPASEDGPAVPVTEYGRSKLAAEQIVKESASLPWTIVRPASVYGSRDRQFLPLFRLAARGLFPLMTEPSAAYTLLHVEDLVRAIVLAATDTRAAAQTFFVGHRDVATPDALWRALAGAFDRAYRPRRIPWPVIQGLASVGELWWKLGRPPLIDRARLTELRASGFVCSSEHIRRTLGFEAAVGLEEGVRGTARWYRENGWV